MNGVGDIDLHCDFFSAIQSSNLCKCRISSVPHTAMRRKQYIARCFIMHARKQYVLVKHSKYLRGPFCVCSCLCMCVCLSVTLRLSGYGVVYEIQHVSILCGVDQDDSVRVCAICVCAHRVGHQGGVEVIRSVAEDLKGSLRILRYICDIAHC